MRKEGIEQPPSAEPDGIVSDQPGVCLGAAHRLARGRIVEVTCVERDAGDGCLTTRQ